MYLLPVALAAIAGGVVASPLSTIVDHSSYAVKETHNVPRGFHAVGQPDPDQVLDLKIGLRNKNFAELERHLYEVSDPAHPRYRQHFSKRELDDLVRPDDDTSNSIDAWLEEYGIDAEQRKYSSARDWVTVSLSVSKVEALLNTKYLVYKHEDGSSMVRTTQWSLPQDLHDHISTIQPTTAFLRSSPQVQTYLLSPDTNLQEDDFPPTQTELNGICNWVGVSPACLRTLYGTDGYVPRSPDSHIAFTNYLGEVANRTDAAIFLRLFRPEAVSSAQVFEQVSIDSGPIDNGTGGGGLEGNLDFQTIAGQVWPINITSYSTGGSPPFNASASTRSNTNEPYLVWLDEVLDQEDLPQTISTSYGDDEQTVPLSYAQAVCEGFARLGLRGVSLLFSSGDFGVGNNGTCVSNDGENNPMFLPNFPASCPYITAVGGTRGYPEEVAYNPFSAYVSGSGFSRYFSQPEYQKQSGVVDAYVESLNGQHDGLYNNAGRAYPDVSAQGYQYILVYGAEVITIDGTSASAPTVASIISLVNDALLAAGKPPLGFLNPWLYSGAGAEAFTDVVNGTTTGCDGPGFAAAPGWDAASGWGTPQFPTMLEILGLDNSTAGVTMRKF